MSREERGLKGYTALDDSIGLEVFLGGWRGQAAGGPLSKVMGVLR